MVAAAKVGAQDMPPKGGYESIQWERIPLKTVFTVRRTIALMVISSSLAWYGYYLSYKKFRREKIEKRSARLAVLPLLVAERDRLFLKQCRTNRDLERELMKNDPDWEVGTYYREPIYITEPNRFHEPSWSEFVAHAHPVDGSIRRLRRCFFMH